MNDLRGNPLAAEIIKVLIVKVLLLGVLWAAFFSTPLDQRSDYKPVGDALFGSGFPELTATSPKANSILAKER
ncbi:MAG: hypothetical protein GC138_04290 [Gammaproteobacteria bacterium]|nr:hypothetical protein [Gammaproteobacteria bacterium]